MLEELRHFSSLGGPSYYWELLSLFANNKTKWSKSKIDSHFKGKIFDGRDIYDGGLSLLLLSGLLELDFNGFYQATYEFKQKPLSFEDCREKVLRAFVELISKDSNVYKIFSNEFCTYDFVNNKIQISRAAFGLHYSNVRDVLLNLEFLQVHPYYPNQSYIINDKYKQLFDKYFAEGLRKKQLHPELLFELQTRQEENGLIGEKYVYEYEMRRLKKRKGIEWVASYDAAAGFDIMSYDKPSSSAHNRFIEVKAYRGDKPYFYWSKNEIKAAYLKAERYFLYLVNLKNIEEPGYEPIIIKNPAIEVLKNDYWKAIIDKYFITYTGN